MRGAKTMDNPMDTGNSYIDGIGLIFIWSLIGIDKLFAYMGLGFMGWADAPVFLACLASASVFVKNIWEMLEKRKQKRQRRR